MDQNTLTKSTILPNTNSHYNMTLTKSTTLLDNNDLPITKNIDFHYNSKSTEVMTLLHNNYMTKNNYVNHDNDQDPINLVFPIGDNINNHGMPLNLLNDNQDLTVIGNIYNIEDNQSPQP